MNILNKFIVATLPAVPKSIIKKFASRYIAGEELSDAVALVKQLNKQGMMATLDVLGEHIRQKEEALAARDTILQVLNTIALEHLDSNVSIKLTQLGLKLDKKLCLQLTESLAKRARELNNFIRIDMEDSSTTDDTLWVYRELRKSYANVGIVLQAYLHRTEQDANTMINDGLTNFRLCKGIYIEPENIAFKTKGSINENYLRVLRTMMTRKAYVGIATHDSALVEGAYSLVKELSLQKSMYEFQMLLGVRPELRAKILSDGHRLRVYIPFGKQWYQYSIRRFKENPQIAGNVIKALFARHNSN